MEAYRNEIPINNDYQGSNIEIFVNIGANPPRLFAIYDAPSYDNTYNTLVLTKKVQKFSDSRELIEFLDRNNYFNAASEYQKQHEKGNIISYHGQDIEIQTIESGNFYINQREAEFRYFNVGDGSFKKIELPLEITKDVIRQLAGDYEIIDTTHQELSKEEPDIPRSATLRDIVSKPTKQINPISAASLNDMANRENLSSNLERALRRKDVFGPVEYRRGTISKLKGTKGFVLNKLRRFRNNFVDNLKIYVAAIGAVTIMASVGYALQQAFAKDDGFINQVNPNRFKSTDSHILNNKARVNQIITNFLTYNYQDISDDDLTFFFDFLNYVDKDNFNGDKAMSFYDYYSLTLDAEAKALLGKISTMYEESFTFDGSYHVSKEKASKYVLFMASISFANENSIYDAKNQSERDGYARTREMNVWESLPPIIKAIEYQRAEEMAAQIGFSFNDNNRPRLYNADANRAKDQTDVIVGKFEEKRQLAKDYMLHLIYKERENSTGRSSK